MTGITLTRRHALAGLALAAMPLSKAWADAGGAALTFLAVGDWGRDGKNNQQEVADRMGETAAAVGARFVISTGDNFYKDGVASVEDPIWKTSFEDVYTAPALQVPWYAALGNHDYRGNVDAQIAYSGRSRRWRMPGRWFSVQQQAPDGATVEVFVIDTSPMISGYYQETGKTKVAGQDVPGQIAWLERSLAASRADWKIVVGHHPIYNGRVPGSDAEDNDGPGDGADLVGLIDPILQRHRVPLYMNGHNHELQHVRRGLTDYVCTGAGSKMRETCDAEGADFCSLEPGFVVCAANRARLRVAYRDAKGAELHVIDIPRSRT